MMLPEIYAKVKREMTTAMAQLVEAMKTINTGRASSILVEDITVNQYGSNVPLKQVATIMTPDATLITVTPWDKALVSAIETAIRESGRNLNPTNDGTMVRIALPPMSLERRQEMVKLLHKIAEETRVLLRNIRKDAWENIQTSVKAGELTEDDKYAAERELNKIIEQYNSEVAKTVEDKEKNLLSI